jgi:hypothetical protein
MRPWAGPFGFTGAAASLVFWLVVPFVADVPGPLVIMATLLAMEVPQAGGAQR